MPGNRFSGHVINRHESMDGMALYANSLRARFPGIYF